MRTWVAGIVFSPLLISAAVYLTGCFRFDLDCELNPILECGSWTPKGTGGASSSSSSGSGTGGVPASCEGDPTNDAGIIRDDCFAFASASPATGGKGTKASPFASLQEAIDAVKNDGRRVLACADQPFAEEIVVPAGVEVVGGFDCTAWGWTDAARTTIAPGAGKLPLKLTSGTGTTVLRSLGAVAANAVNPGASSIAAIIDGGAGMPLSVELSRCDFSAGKGAAGAKGNAPVGTGEDGAPGNPGNPGCSDVNDVLGGSSKDHVCGGDSSQGGGGGIGNASVISAGDGSAGKQPPTVMGPAGENGEAGKGEQGAFTCKPGGTGAIGAEGDPGAGAAGIGTIDAKGFVGATGAAGTSAGTPGQGGGGGGGAKAGHCMGQPTFSGPSGGSGGSGGCGGLPANGGGFGGSSIGIMSLNAQLKLTMVTITAKDGGTGGDGGDGQTGGSGGNGGGTANNNPSACQGGKGGQGGLGGAGGGGLGGHSLGLAVKGPLPTLDMGTQKAISFGMQGAGGLGGNMDLKMNDGAAGVAAAQQLFVQ
jgi:hypothetical protein